MSLYRTPHLTPCPNKDYFTSVSKVPKSQQVVAMFVLEVFVTDTRQQALAACERDDS
jgi:hypothetical protein